MDFTCSKCLSHHPIMPKWPTLMSRTIQISSDTFIHILPSEPPALSECSEGVQSPIEFDLAIFERCLKFKSGSSLHAPLYFRSLANNSVAPSFWMLQNAPWFLAGRTRRQSITKSRCTRETVHLQTKDGTIAILPWRVWDSNRRKMRP